MTTQTLTPIQRELDAIQQQLDRRFKDVVNYIDKFVTMVQYQAELRGIDAKFHDIQDDISELRKDLRLLDTDFEKHFNALQAAINAEELSRRQENLSDKKEKSDNRRTNIGLFLVLSIPAIATLIAPLLTHAK